MQWIKDNKQRAALAGIILAGLFVRLVVAFIMGNQVQDLPGLNDQITYHTLAQRVMGGHGFSFGENWWPATHADMPTAHWSYLYTFYLIAVYSLFGPNPLAARLIQVLVVAILQPLLVYKIGAVVFNRWVGLVAAALLTGYTYLIYYSPALLTEPFYIIAVLAVMYLSMRLVQKSSQDGVSNASKIGVAAALGLSIGAAILLRQLFLLIVPFVFLWIAIALRKKLGWTAAQLAISGAIAALMILPFTLYNYARFGSFVLLNTNAGYAFYWANHPIYGTQFESIISPETGNYREMLPAELNRLNLNEAQLEQELLQRGIQFIIQDPGRYVMLSLSRVPLYFMFWPTPNSSLLSNLSRMASFGLAWPFMLYGLILAVLRFDKRQLLASPMFLLIAFFAIYSMIHILTWTLVRYRMPVDTVLLIFAAYGLRDLYQRFQQSRRASTIETRGA